MASATMTQAATSETRNPFQVAKVAELVAVLERFAAHADRFTEDTWTYAAAEVTRRRAARGDKRVCHKPSEGTRRDVLDALRVIEAPAPLALAKQREAERMALPAENRSCPCCGAGPDAGREDCQCSMLDATTCETHGLAPAVPVADSCVVCRSPSTERRRTSLFLRPLPVCGTHDVDLIRCHWCAAIVPLSGPHSCEAMEAEQAKVMTEWEAAKARAEEERMQARARREMEAIEGRNRLAEKWGKPTFRCPCCSATKPASEIGMLTIGDPLCKLCARNLD